MDVVTITLLSVILVEIWNLERRLSRIEGLLKRWFNNGFRKDS